MNFFDYFPNGNIFYNSSLTIENGFSQLNKTMLLLSEKINEYKKDVTKYTVIQNTQKDYIDLAYEYYDDKSLWWVIAYFNDHFDIMNSFVLYDEADRKVEEWYESVLYFMGALSEGAHDATISMAFTYAYPFSDVIDINDQRDIVMVIDLLREFFVVVQKESIQNAIIKANEAINEGDLFDDLDIEEAFKSFLYAKALKSLDTLTVKIPVFEVVQEMIDLMEENSENWRKHNEK